MAYLLKEKIFPFFGVDAKRRDTFKDINGKGISERYQEALGDGYDDEVSDLVDNLLDNILVPKTMKATHIHLMEWMLGGIVRVNGTTAMRRKIIGFAHTIYNIKGTAKSYEVLLRLLGFATVTIEELVEVGTFDSDTTFDDEFRTFDSDPGCGCAKYNVLLTGGVSVSDEMIIAIYRIINFLEPINATLGHVYYNGSEISPVTGIFDDTFDDTFN